MHAQVKEEAKLVMDRKGRMAPKEVGENKAVKLGEKVEEHGDQSAT